jgi:hypothetical protein
VAAAAADSLDEGALAGVAIAAQQQASWAQAAGLAAAAQITARAVEAKVLPGAGRLTKADLKDRLRHAVIAVDPEGAEERRKAAERHADVRLYAEDDQTAAIVASKQPQIEAAAGFVRITALARPARRPGCRAAWAGTDPRCCSACCWAPCPLLPRPKAHRPAQHLVTTTRMRATTSTCSGVTPIPASPVAVTALPTVAARKEYQTTCPRREMRTPRRTTGSMT